MAKRQHNSVFKQVDYSEFRQHLATISTGKVKEKGFETIIYDRKGSIQAILHAASIDSNGNCYPAEYFVLGQATAINLPLAA
jgi:hypothetical protein